MIIAESMTFRMMSLLQGPRPGSKPETGKRDCEKMSPTASPDPDKASYVGVHGGFLEQRLVATSGSHVQSCLMLKIVPDQDQILNFRNTKPRLLEHPNLLVACAASPFVSQSYKQPRLCDCNNNYKTIILILA